MPVVLVDFFIRIKLTPYGIPNAFSFLMVCNMISTGMIKQFMSEITKTKGTYT